MCSIKHLNTHGLEKAMNFHELPTIEYEYSKLFPHFPVELFMDVWIAVYVSQALDQCSFFGQILLHLILKRCVFWLLVTETKKLFLQVIPSTWHGEKNMVRITNGTLQKWGGIHRILSINSHLKNSELEDHFLEQLHPKCEVFSAVCGKLWLLPAHPVSF